MFFLIHKPAMGNDKNSFQLIPKKVFSRHERKLFFVTISTLPAKSCNFPKLQPSNLLTSSADSIILWMHAGYAMKLLKCTSVFNGLTET